MVTWTEILSDCEDADQGYRQRIVAVFRKYEGQETDERDGSNRVVKVTAASFAHKLGIHEDTFRVWAGMKKVTGNIPVTSPESPGQEVDQPSPVDVRPAPQPNPVPVPDQPVVWPEKKVDVGIPVMNEMAALMEFEKCYMDVNNVLGRMLELVLASKEFEDQPNSFAVFVEEIKGRISTLEAALAYDGNLSPEDFL